MGSFYTPNIPYDRNTWLDNLPAYSLTEESAETIELAREIIDTESYYFLGLPFPGSSDTLLGPHASFVGNINVPPLSYLVLLTGDVVFADGDAKMRRSGAGFQLRIFDKGGKIDTVINTQFAANTTLLGVMDSIHPNRPMGPLFPCSPMVILHPGSVQLEITNLADANVYAQVLLQFAVPLSRKSTSEMLIKKGSNG